MTNESKIPAFAGMTGKNRNDEAKTKVTKKT
jgi:hypothetical protein